MATKPKKRSAPKGWRDDLEKMPKKGRFKALQFKEVFLYDERGGRVCDPVTGRIFSPYLATLMHPY